MNKVFFGDCRDTMRDLIAQGVKVQMCVTSPPYFGLRDYGHPGQLGLEPTPAAYVAAMVEVFSLVWYLLTDDGVLFLNLGDSYAANRGYQVASTLMNGDATNKAQAGDGHGLLLLMEYADRRYTEDASVLEPDEVGTWPTSRWLSLRERGRRIIAEDLDIWDDDIKRAFGFDVHNT